MTRMISQGEKEIATLRDIVAGLHDVDNDAARIVQAITAELESEAIERYWTLIRAARTRQGCPHSCSSMERGWPHD